MRVNAVATRGLLLLALACAAIFDAWDMPQFWTRVLGFLPVLILYTPVVYAFERRAALQRYTAFAWVSLFTLFAIGLLVGESPPTLLAVLLLGGVVATTRDRLTGILIGVFAAGTALYLSRQDAAVGSERFYLALSPVLLLAGLYCGLLVRSADQAWEESENLREELAEQAEQINYVLACVASGVLVVDGKLRILTYNRAAERILGVPEHTVVGRELGSVAQLAALSEVFAVSPSSANDSETPRRDLEFVRPDGQRIWVGYAVSRLENRAARQLGLVLVFQDVTLIRDYAARMLQQEQLAALGRMVSGIAHEFGNILGGARGLIELAMLDEPDEAVETLPVVKETLSRALETVDNLLRFARGTPLNRVAGVESRAVLERALILLTADLERGQLTVETQFEEVSPLLADAVQLEQVFINLIINAVHAVDGQDDRRLRISVAPGEDGGLVVIRFEDTGPGVPGEVLGRVFEPFFTTKGSLGGSKVPGTGLGLSIALGVIEGHEGTISAGVSPDLGGACFTISLPSTKLEPPSDS